VVERPMIRHDDITVNQTIRTRSHGRTRRRLPRTSTFGAASTSLSAAGTACRQPSCRPGRARAPAARSRH
jgi:hypothetical protein